MKFTKLSIFVKESKTTLSNNNFIRNKSVLQSPVSSEALAKAKPFNEVPGPKSYPIIGGIHNYLPGIGNYSVTRLHESYKKIFQQYGKIVREDLLGFSMIHLFDPKDMKTIAKHEGTYPNRDFFVSMKMIREKKPHIFKTVGLVAGNGESWYNDRKKFQKVFMRPAIIKQRLPQVNEIADELINKIRLVRMNNMQVPNLKDELCKWSIESMVSILFNQRFGYLDKDLPKNSKAMKYIQAINDFFFWTGKVEFSFLQIWRHFPSLSLSYKKFEKVHNFIYENAMVFVNENISKAQTNTEDKDLSLIMQLLQYCTPEEASVMAVDAMAASVDTTALSMAYVLYHLAVNPEAQKKLQQEIDQVMPNGSPMTSEIMDNIPYLRACIKESMRLTPVASGISRKIDKDIVLSGYRIPKDIMINSHFFISSLQEENFEDPHTFKPERWIKDASCSKAVESFAFQPFGFGPRMCIGRRIAEMEMFALLSKIVQNFWIENKDKKLDIRFQLVLMIENELKYEFHERWLKK